MDKESEVVHPSTIERDKTDLRAWLYKAEETGGITLGCKTSSLARTLRRRMYYVMQQLDGPDRQRANNSEILIKGRMIVIMPKKSLSSELDTELAMSEAPSQPFPFGETDGSSPEDNTTTEGDSRACGSSASTTD